MTPALARRLHRLAGIAAICVTGAVHAQAEPTPASYAVLSLIGNDLSVVTYQPAVGSRLDSNLVEHLPIDGAQFDRLAVQSAIGALKRSVPGAQTRSITSTDRSLAESTDELSSSEAGLKVLLQDLAPQLQGAGTRYLLVVSKHRGDARIQMAHGAMGSGKLRGLGFYIDSQYRTRAGDSGRSGRGFIAPFAYLSVSLVDLATGTVLRSESASEARAVATARSETAAAPWDALTGDEKVNFLNRLILRTISTVVPHVVAPV